MAAPAPAVVDRRRPGRKRYYYTGFETFNLIKQAEQCIDLIIHRLNLFIAAGQPAAALSSLGAAAGLPARRVHAHGCTLCLLRGCHLHTQRVFLHDVAPPHAPHPSRQG
eukprot:1238694-Rhodomonas_salina.1